LISSLGLLIFQFWIKCCGGLWWSAFGHAVVCGGRRLDMVGGLRWSELCILG